MYGSRLRRKMLYCTASLMLLCGCARTYLSHPFPELPLNDKRYEADRKDYAGSIDIKRRQNYLPFSKTRVYYNGRRVGKAGTRDSLRLFFYADKYLVETTGINKHTDTVDFTTASAVNLGHGIFFDPIMVVYKSGRRIYISQVDTLAAKRHVSNERESQ